MTAGQTAALVIYLLISIGMLRALKPPSVGQTRTFNVPEKDHWRIVATFRIAFVEGLVAVTETAPVPAEANFWGFHLKATERATGMSRVYRAMITKELCGSRSAAEAVLVGDSIQFLKSLYLDSYEADSHPMVWPDLTPGWLVI